MWGFGDDAGNLDENPELSCCNYVLSTVKQLRFNITTGTTAIRRHIIFWYSILCAPSCERSRSSLNAATYRERSGISCWIDNYQLLWYLVSSKKRRAVRNLDTGEVGYGLENLANETARRRSQTLFPLRVWSPKHICTNHCSLWNNGTYLTSAISR